MQSVQHYSGLAGEIPHFTDELRKILRISAEVSDKNYCVPTGSINALRGAHFFRYLIDPSFDGIGGTATGFSKLTALVAEECLSSAIIWSMHTQQVVTLSALDFKDKKKILSDVAKNGSLIASVTTEREKGGELLKTSTKIERKERQYNVSRSAPIVSIGELAKYYLITMQDENIDHNTVLVLVGRNEGTIEKTGDWNAMGMRGTQSVPMKIDVSIDDSQIVCSDFKNIAMRSMIPYGHLAYASAWYGASRGLLNKTLQYLRNKAAKDKSNLNSETLRKALAQCRLSLDLLECLIEKCAEEIDDIQSTDIERFKNTKFNILINNLKVGASQLSFEIANQLMEIAGLFNGYIPNEDLPIERVFRDLRSASLMFKNERLLQANGHLVFVEKLGKLN